MPSRRDFLITAAASAIAMSARARARAVVERPFPGGQPAAGPTLNGGALGLQLWSVRDYLPKDLKGTIQKVRDLGFREIEAAGLWKHSVAEQRAALDASGLRCQSAHMSFERLRDDMHGAIAEVQALGATWIVCPWIPHKDDVFTREDALKSAEAFNKFASAAHDAGLRFAYHCHGYEFVRSPEGTLFDTLAGATDASSVMFEIDVFHALLGGADPAKLIEKYASRVASLHLKDLKKGFPITVGRATAPPEADVPVGTGQVAMPAVLKAAATGGTKLYYIEDESADPWQHIPESLKYLQEARRSKEG
jgi:sugar phosphate isomerase/epimerase